MRTADETDGEATAQAVSSTQGVVTILTTSQAAILLAMVSAVAGTLLYMVLSPLKGVESQEITSHFVGERFNYRALLLSYGFFLSLLIGSAAVLKFYAASLDRSLRNLVTNSIRVVLPTSAAILLITALVMSRGSLRVLLATLAVCAVSAILVKIGGKKLFVAVSVVAVLSLSLAQVLPGLQRTPSLVAYPEEQLATVENHYAFVVGPADRLSAGHKLGKDVRARYGMLPVTLLAVWEKANRLLSFGETVMVVRWLQTAFLVVACLLYLMYARGRVWCALPAILMLVPLMQPGHPQYWHPNSSAWRYFCILLLPAFLVAARGLSQKAAWLLGGSVSTIAFLWNPETGAMVSIGCACYLLLNLSGENSGNTFNKLITHVPALVSGSIVALVAVMLVFYAGLGYVPDLLSWSLRIIQSTGSVVEVSGKRDFSFDPGIAIILLANAFLLIRIGSTSIKGLDSGARIRAALCLASLLWFPFYLNKSYVTSAVLPIFYFGFILTDFVWWWTTNFKGMSLLWKWTTSLICAVLLVRVVAWHLQPFWLEPLTFSGAGSSNRPGLGDRFGSSPRFGSGYGSSIAKYRSRLAAQKRIVVSGVELRKEPGEELLAKIAFIQKAAQHSAAPIVYLTANSMFVSKGSGVVPDIPVDEVFFSLKTRRDLDRLISGLVFRKPAEIYIDDPAQNIAGNKPRRDCFESIRGLLSFHYQLKDTRDGWQIWVPKN